MDNTDVYLFMTDFDNDDLPDGAWWAMLEQGVREFNENYKSNYDECDTVHEYLHWAYPESND